jgi:hypothetical protein
VSGIIKIDGRGVPYEDPYILVDGREIPMATSGRAVELDPIAGSIRNSCLTLRQPGGERLAAERPP